MTVQQEADEPASEQKPTPATLLEQPSRRTELLQLARGRDLTQPEKEELVGLTELDEQEDRAAEANELLAKEIARVKLLASGGVKQCQHLATEFPAAAQGAEIVQGQFQVLLSAISQHLERE